ncbi:MAG: hypothetical protein Kow00133_13610 [Amphiplicatus sp.]
MTKRVAPHDSSWSRWFEEEAARLRPAFGPALVALHHVGSTAIPGILAKPVIDILVEAVSLVAIDERASAMRALGYEVMGEYGIQGRRYFKRKGASGAPGFHVHAYEAGSEDVRRHLAFRDYLLAHADEAQAYSALKASLADENGLLVDDYQERKSNFVRRAM